MRIEKFDNFVLSQKKVLLLHGAAGSGKTFLCEEFFNKAKQDCNTIAIYITLGKYYQHRENFLSIALAEQKFDLTQIGTKKLLLFLDGFDELSYWQNIWISQNLTQYQAQIIITCRSECLFLHTNYRIFFEPIINQKRRPDLLVEESVSNIHAIEVKAPLSISITHPLALQLIKKRMSQYEVYDKNNFIKELLTDWFKYHEQKYQNLGLLDKKDIAFIDRCWEFNILLAKALKNQNSTLITATHSKLFASKPSEWEEIFYHSESALLRQACPIQTVTQGLAFIHKEIFDYFCNQPYSSPKSAVTVKAPEPVPAADSQPHYLNLKLIVGHPDFLSLLADRVWEDERFKADLLNLLYASRKDDSMVIGATNAITILNKARMPFSGMDLSQIKVPYAYLPNAIFDRTNLSHAELKGVYISDGFLRETNFSSSNLQDVDYGGYYIEIVEPEIMGSFISNVPLLGNNKINSMFYCPEQNYLAISAYRKISVIDLNSQCVLSKIEVNGENDNAICVLPEKNWLAVGGSGKIVKIYDLDGRFVKQLPKQHTAPINMIKFSPNGKFLASAASNLSPFIDLESMASSPSLLEIDEIDERVLLWNIDTNVTHILSNHARAAYCVDFSSDSMTLAAGSCDGQIHLWNTSSAALLQKLFGHTKPVIAVAFLSDEILVSGSIDHTVRIWDLKTRNCSMILKNHIAAVTTIAISPDKFLMASGGEDNIVYLWRTDDYHCLAKFTGHGFTYFGQDISISQLAFVPYPKDLNKQALAIGVTGSTAIHLQPIHSGIQNFEDSSHIISTIQFIGNQSQLVSCSFDGTLQQWDITTGRCLYQRKLNGLVPITLLQNGTLVALSSQNEIKIIDVTTKKCYRSIPKPDIFDLTDIESLEYCYKTNMMKPPTFVFSKNAEYLINLKKENPGIWHLTRKVLLLDLKKFTDEPIFICFNYDDTAVAIVFNNDSIRHWTLSPDFEPNKFKVFSIKKAYSLAFSPDNRLLAVGNDDAVHIFNLYDQQKLYELKAHKYYIIGLHFSPNSRWLASTCNDARLCFWDMHTGQLMEKQSFHLSQIHHMLFSDDGRYFSIATKQQIQLFEIKTNLAEEDVPELKTSLRWQTDGVLRLDQVNFYNAKGLLPLDIDLLANHHGSAEKTLIGGLSNGSLSTVLWYMYRQGYKPNQQIIRPPATALLCACAAGYLPLVELLLSTGSLLEEQNAEGHTPLIYAIMHRRLKVVAYLLMRGASVNKQDRGGYTALHWAVDRENIPIAGLLLKYKASLFTIAKNSATPLRLAVFVKNIPLLILLLNAVPHAQLNTTIIDLIATANDVKIMTWLMIYGSKRHFTNSNNVGVNSPFMKLV